MSPYPSPAKREKGFGFKDIAGLAPWCVAWELSLGSFIQSLTIISDFPGLCHIGRSGVVQAHKEWKLKAWTPIWTGDTKRNPARLIPTGIMGSLRWWYEVLVRGLGGKACDPTSDVRCPDQNGRHCVVCELFGCTGWARETYVRNCVKPPFHRRAGNGGRRAGGGVLGQPEHLVHRGDSSGPGD